MVHQRTASSDSERGYDATGSEVHEGGKRRHHSKPDSRHGPTRQSHQIGTEKRASRQRLIS